jgi:hypothetical protein
LKRSLVDVMNEEKLLNDISKIPTNWEDEGGVVGE